MLTPQAKVTILSAFRTISTKHAAPKGSFAIVSTRPRTYKPHHHSSSSVKEHIFNRELAERDRLRVRSRYNAVATSNRQLKYAQAWKNVNHGVDNLQQAPGGEPYDISKRRKGQGEGTSGAAGASSGQEPLTDEYDNIDERTSLNSHLRACENKCLTPTCILLSLLRTDLKCVV